MPGRFSFFHMDSLNDLGVLEHTENWDLVVKMMKESPAYWNVSQKQAPLE